jgi:hypothetical protein
MPIQSGDVKLLKSAVMADVPEGGGAPTGNVIADGVSNAIFPDISELDRAGGRVNLRKTFVSIQTDDQDLYFGGNVIVAEPPQDPRVSVTLFSNGLTFDRRTEAQSRVESYLNKGPEWNGYLYENHIAGQRVIQLFQRPNSELPVVGQTVVLIENESLGTQKEQYVRATSVSSVEQTFTYNQGGTAVDYKAWVVTLDISDALRFDFTGSPASRLFTRTTDGVTAAPNRTKIRDTVVADAGTYVGVVPLTETADLGDFTVKGESIFTQLVPSAQTETPISDIRTNGLSAALVSTGAPVTVSLSLAFTTSQNMHVGGPIYPASLTVSRSGITVTDQGGRLISSGAEVGQVDYDNGVLTLSTNVFGTGSGTHSVTFTPATLPELISSQGAIRISPQNQGLSYVFTMEPVPARRTFSISYLAQGRWYVLRDDGSGTLRGIDAAYGIGTLNYTTGAVVVTLGALPDVGSALVIQSFSESLNEPLNNTTLLNGGKFYVPINTSGLQSEEKGAKTIGVGTLVVQWNDGTVRTATDNGLGGFTGDATGTIDYSAGVVRISPNALPPSGTVFLMDLNGLAGQVAPNVSLANGSVGATNLEPGSVSISVTATISYATSQYSYANPKLAFTSRAVILLIYDDGLGVLKFTDPGNNDVITCGTVNYATGVVNVTALSPAVSTYDAAGPPLSWNTTDVAGQDHTGTFSWNSLSSKTRSLSITTVTTGVNYSTGTVGPDSISVTVTQFVARTLMVPNYSLRGMSFGLGSARYVQLPDNTLSQDPSATTGVGTPVGSVSPALGACFLSGWPVGAAPTVLNARGMIVPPNVGVEAPFTSFETIFRTASTPIRPGSFSVLGTMMDGTTFNVTAGTDGKINGTRVKGRIDYEYGLVELFFVNPAGDSGMNKDLSFLGIPGLAVIPVDLVRLNSIRYNAVSFSYLPLDAELLGIDPVRLPSDGRVPIFRPGGFAVVGHTGEITQTVANSDVVNCGRVRLSRVRVIGNDGIVINTGYTAGLEAGTVTFTDVAGYSQPVTIQHRIEDMGVVRQTDINGEITFTRPLTHNYPLGSYLSSALIAGDLFARVPLVFDQTTWNGTFSDTPGTPATATFNNVTYPITVSNRGALTERWAVQFVNSTSFNIIGENTGVIATGNTSTDCAPINPNTGVPYFTIPALGWGSGWATGNVLRFNTIGAMFPVWVVRTVQQGPETVPDDQFTLLVRGDVDTP